MKTIKHFLLITCLSAGLSTLAADPAPGSPTNAAPGILAAPATASERATNVEAAPVTPGLASDQETNAVAGANGVAGTNAIAEATPAVPPVVMETGTNGLRMNFNKAPLNLVLDYLSDAAGFIINKVADVRGTVDVQGKDLTKDEAVEVLNSALRKNGYAVLRNGRILTIVSQDGVNHTDTPIAVGNNPEEVGRGDDVVTQIIPVKYASVSQLVPNLELLLPTTATLTPNESANSLILVATRTDISRMLRIINALDTSIASVSSIKVIPLKNADAKDTATLITSLFTSQGNGQAGGGGGRGNLFAMMAGGFGGRGGGFGGRGGGNAGGQTGGAAGAAAAKVVAVGDDRSNSLVVSAPADLLATIETMVKEIDQEVIDLTELQVFRLVNADPSETADQLATLFPDETSANNANQNNLPFFMRGPGNRRGGTTPTANESDRTKKMGRVLAVPDPRSSSLIVMASKTLMPQIADMIAELDAEKGRKEVVGYFDLKNADPSDVYNNLQDLFQRNSTSRANNNNVNPNMGQNSPLYMRSKNNPQTTTSGMSSGGLTGGTSSRGGVGF